jgi:D-alanine-D-alanine ligase
MKKIRLLVLAGGRSDEHEVSIISTRSLIEALAGSDIEVTPLVIARDGTWLTVEESAAAISRGTIKSGGEPTLHRARVVEEYDVVFPLLHGPYGEDGTIQGMLEMADIPYIGAGVLASSLCMDKPMSKDALAAHDIPQVRWVVTTRRELRDNPDAVVARCSELPAPWFVKPANLGSSVGITRVTDAADLRAALDAAAALDRRIIVEEGVANARELEVAILGNDEPAASVLGEITYGSDFYDYETKYTDGRADLHIPADVPDDVVERVQTLGKRAFRILDCAGFARVDFLYDNSSDALVLNEVNTIPGFTPFSMFTKLWEASGVPYAQLVARLAELALERFAERQR